MTPVPHSRPRHRPLPLALAVAALAACTPTAGGHPVDIELSPPPSLVQPQPLPAVTPSRLLTLPVEGYGTATVVTPSTEAPSPLTIVLHGAYDRPEWVCEIFRRIARGRSWVLCIRGTLRPEQPADGPRWTLGKPSETLTELEAAERALRAHYAPHVAAGPPILAGFSKGAYQAAWLAARHPKRFPRLMLTEGGHSTFRGRRLTRFATRGGQAVAWGCGTPGCRTASHHRCRLLTKRSVPCRVETDLAVGHSYNPPFPKIGTRLFTWLLTHDPTHDPPPPTP